LNPGFYRAVVDIVKPEIGMILRLGATTNISPEGEQEILVADVEQLIPLLIN
jgi:DhnA family fructose-bisphosphate aldolase class Ia